MGKIKLFLGASILLFVSIANAEITQVDQATLTNITDFISFGDGGDFGTSVVSYGEKFSGQTTTLGGPVGVSEILSGSPTDPLSLVSGGSSGVCFFPGSIAGRIADTFLSCGEGSIAFLFDEDQSEIGIDFDGLSGGNVYVSFYRRDGSLIDDFTLTWVGESAGFGFLSLSTIPDIAGFTVHNDDFAGMVIDSLSFGGACSDADGCLPVSIDIKPDSDPNSINPRSKGVIPVAVLGSTDFLATDVDVLTVTFGPNGATPAHDGHVEDVNDDGYMDMMFHFRTQETGIVCGDTEATLTGELYDSTPIGGTDTVRTVGCKDTSSEKSSSTESAGALSWMLLIGLSVLGLWRQNRRQ